MNQDLNPIIQQSSFKVSECGTERLIEIKAKYPLVYDIRGLGLFFGIELRIDNQPALKAAEDILYHSLSQGLSYKIGAGCVLTVCPPLTITEAELFSAFDILEQGLNAVAPCT